jgi:hypothetical protein
MMSGKRMGANESEIKAKRWRLKDGKSNGRKRSAERGRGMNHGIH